MWSCHFHHFHSSIQFCIALLCIFFSKVIHFNIKISSEGSSSWEGKGYANDIFVSLSSLRSSSKDRGSSEQSLAFVNNVMTPIQSTNRGQVKDQGKEEEAIGERKWHTFREICVDITVEGDKQNLLEASKYGWVEHEVHEYATRFRWDNNLVDLVGQTYILKANVEDNTIHLCVCQRNDQVCLGMENSKLDFFFIYSYLFTDLFVHVLFEDFQQRVLQKLNVAPSQIQPNAWAIVQTFNILCISLGLTPTSTLFLHHYHARLITCR